MYDEPFEDLAVGIQPGTEGSPPWSCNGERRTYDNIRLNVFCGGGEEMTTSHDAAYLVARRQVLRHSHAWRHLAPGR